MCLGLLFGESGSLQDVGGLTGLILPGAKSTVMHLF